MSPAPRNRETKKRRVVSIGGVEYRLDMRRKRLQAVHDPWDVIDLSDDGHVDLDGEVD